MEHVINNKAISNATTDRKNKITNLSQGEINCSYIIKDVVTNDEDIKNFLFTLGCYEGEKVTVISILAENFVIIVKDARYSIDQELAEAIII